MFGQRERPAEIPAGQTVWESAMAVKTEAAARKTEHPEHPSQEIPIALHGRDLVPNKRIPLDVSWVEEVRVNTSAVERRAATIGTRRSVKKAWQDAWLLPARHKLLRAVPENPLGPLPPRRDQRPPPQRQEGLAGRLASPRHLLHGPH